MIIAIHVPKTAGTTFSQYLLSAFPGRVLRDYEPTTGEVGAWFDSCFDHIMNHRGKGDVRIRLISYGLIAYRELLSKHGIQVINGHFDINKYWGIFPDATYVTWLREPVQRALSQYHYYRRLLVDPPDPTNRLIYEGRLSFTEWMTAPQNINLQSRFTGIDLSKFKFVGISEEYEFCLSLFRQTLGLEHQDFDFDVAPENVNPEKPINERYAVDPETESRFNELNDVDVALYRAAIARLNANSITAECRGHQL